MTLLNVSRKIILIIAAVLISCFISLRIFHFINIFINAPFLITNIAAFIIIISAFFFVADLFKRNNYIIGNKFIIANLVLGIIFSFFTSSKITFANEINAPYFYLFICNIGAGIICGFFTAVILISVYKILSGRKITLTKEFWIIIFAAMVILMTAIANSRIFYYWDNVIYHELSRAFLNVNYKTMISEIYNSILTWDYNFVPAILPAAFMKLFGTSRWVFITSSYIIYFIPAILMLYFLNNVYKKRLGVNINIQYIYAVIFLPMLLCLTYNGYVDVGGLALMAACVAVYFDEERDIYARLVICALLLCLLIIFRRWYIFWSASFVICAFFDFLIAWKKCLLKTIVLFASFGGILFLFFEKMVVGKYIKGNILSAHNAYALGFSHDVQMFSTFFGLPLMFLVFSGVIFLLFFKDTRRITVFLTSAAILCYLMFTRVQSHDAQHLLLYTPFIFSVLCMSIAKLSKIAGKMQFKILSCIILAVVCLNLLSTLNDNVTVPLMADCKMQMGRVNNTREVLSLLYYLDNLSENETKNILILSVSGNLNSEMLLYAESSFNLSDQKRKYFLNYSSVDTRDGFNDNIFKADYIVVPTTIQAYLGEENQRVISVPTQFFYENKGFANAFVKLPEEFVINNYCTVNIYKKDRDITKEEMADLKNTLSYYYPDLPGLFPKG